MKKTTEILIFYTFLKIISALTWKQNPSPEIQFLDVGQGDAILINAPGPKWILIDGGEDFTVSWYLNQVFPLNNCHLDAVFLTHPHSDHLGGLVRVLNQCTVDRIFYSPISCESSLCGEWENLISNAGFGIRKKPIVESFSLGDKYILDEKSYLYCLWPSRDFVEKIRQDIDSRKSVNLNNISTVILLDSGEFEALLTGDAELEIWEKIRSAWLAESKIENSGLNTLEPQSADTFHIMSQIDGKLDAYKLPHHGSKNGLDHEIWLRLNPFLSVISVGKDNKFNHPSKEVLDWFVENKAYYKRTDLEGTVKIRYNF